MAEVKLFQGAAPEWTTPGWYAQRETAPHLEQPGHRERLILASEMIHVACWSRGFRTVVDLGAGDGGLLSLLEDLKVDRIGYDLQQTNVDAAQRNRGIEIYLQDVVAKPVNWPQPGKAFCAVATEVLEHLVDPHAFVRSIGADTLVASSPWNETEGGAYPFHTWAWDKPGYIDLIEQGGFEVIDHHYVSMFQVVLAVRP